MVRASRAGALWLAICALSFAPASGQESPAPAVPPAGTAACARPNVPPQTIHAVEPSVPARAAQYGIGGHVMTMLSLAADGHVTGVSIVQSSSTLFNRSAAEAARASTFAPEVRGCVPVAGKYAFSVDYVAPQPLPRTLVDASSYFPGTWQCSTATGETRTLTFAHDGSGIDLNDGSDVTSAMQDQYHVWRIRRAGILVGWAYPWVEDAWEWDSRHTNDHALRFRRVDDDTFTLVTSAGSGLAVIQKSERCKRAKPAG